MKKVRFKDVMKTAAMGFSSPPSTTTSAPPSPSSSPTITHRPNNIIPCTATRVVWIPPRSLRGRQPHISSTKGVCRASQAVELFPCVSPEVVVRDVRLADCWEVADTHCSSFFPNHHFPLDFLLRVNRFVGLLSGFSPLTGRNRTCLVAVTGRDVDGNETGDMTVGGLDEELNFNHGCIAGILTLDTMADFLPRRGPQRQRRTGIAYISNVAVRKMLRRRGIGKRLVAMAEARALSWGCRAIALHCVADDLVATSLYKGQGFKCIKIPDGANWPTPKAPRGTQYRFMMKLVTPRPCEQ